MSSPTRDFRPSFHRRPPAERARDLVRRHRALELHAAEGSAQESALPAELIAAEVAHELAVARSALHRHPPLR